MIRTTAVVPIVALVLSVAAAHGAETLPLEANKKTVVEFFEKAINQRDFDAASKYLGGRYIQHDPFASDGADGLRAFIVFLREKFPQGHVEIKRVFADGDYVILHVHSVREPGTRGRAAVEIFRLDSGKIVEHWDVIQEIPEKAANPNGMF